MGDWKVRGITAAYGILTCAIFIWGGSRMYQYSEVMKRENNVYTTNINDVVKDWNQPSYTDIVVVDVSDYPSRRENGCPNTHPHAVFDRFFAGSRTGCNCIGRWSNNIDYDNQIILDRLCTYNETRADCANMYPIWPVHMTNFSGAMVCGKADGTPFINAERPDYNTHECRAGYVNCSNQTSLDNTICVKEDSTDQCPITYINLTRTFLEGSEYKHQKFSDDLWLVTSKQHEGLPISQISLSSVPCMDSHVIVGRGYQTGVEYMQYGDCPFEENSQ